MTPAQKRVFDFIDGYQSEYGFSPSYHEIAEGTGTTKSNVYVHVMNLERLGEVTRHPYSARSIKVNSSLPADLSRELDLYCERHHLKRGEVVIDAITAYLRRNAILCRELKPTC